VGDCFDDPEGPGPGVALKPCSEPHDSEVYAVVAYPSAAQAEFPGDELLDVFAFDACLAEFDRYIDTPFEASSLDAFWLWPDPRTWLGGDRSVVCILFDANLLKLEGSMEGSRR
jgi:hypothetical protein